MKPNFQPIYSQGRTMKPPKRIRLCIGPLSEERGVAIYRPDGLTFRCPHCANIMSHSLAGWNADRTRPTLEAPIHCMTFKYGCGWYGRLTNGWFVSQ